MKLGHIGVRSGSKGIPGKNKMMFEGKPLFRWSLDMLIESRIFDYVVVSTDDEDIYEVAIKLGCIDVGLRSEDLSGGKIAKSHVWKDSWRKVENLIGTKIDLMIDLDVTCPLRTERDIKNLLLQASYSNADLIMSCSESKKNPYFNILEFNQDGYLKVVKSQESLFVTRQSAPRVIDHIANMYCIFPSFIENCETLFSGKVEPFMMLNSKSWDIDSHVDIEIVKYFFSKLSDE